MAFTGTVVTRAYTSPAGLSVPDATVVFTRKEAGPGRHRLLALRISDAAGQTGPVRMETPEPDVSRYPGGDCPFALCDIWVEAPGCHPLLVEDVPVFPDTETLQCLRLLPLPEQAAARDWQGGDQYA